MSLDLLTTQTEATKASQQLVDELGRTLVQDKVLQNAVNIVKEFIQNNEGILYGGFAINELSPDNAKFYNEETQFLDLDVYFTDAKKQTKRLAKLLHQRNIPSVKAKSSMHPGTYKIYVDFQPIVDITDLPAKVYEKLKCDSTISKDGLLIASPDWLRMGLYKELMKPLNDQSRWPIIAPRLALLNRYAQFQLPKQCHNSCMFDNNGRQHQNPKEFKNIMNAIAEYVSKKKLILFGATAFNSFIQYSKVYRFFHLDSYPMRVSGLETVSDFDVFTHELARDTQGIKSVLHTDAHINKNRIHVKEIPGIADLVPKKTEIRVDNEVVIDLYEDHLCPGYIDGKIETDKGTTYDIRIASLPTMVVMWFTLLYTESNKENLHQKQCKIFCAIEFLLNHQSQFVKDPCRGSKPESIRSRFREIDSNNDKWSWPPEDKQ